jgi:hypothetical protein
MLGPPGLVHFSAAAALRPGQPSPQPSSDVDTTEECHAVVALRPGPTLQDHDLQRSTWHRFHCQSGRGRSVKSGTDALEHSGEKPARGTDSSTTPK